MNDFEYLLPGDDMGKFLKTIADSFQRRMNPTFDGHRTTYPGQQPIGWKSAVGYGLMSTSPKAVYAVAARQLLVVPQKNVGIEASPYGSYHLSGGDQVYYPFKGVVDYIFK